MSAAATTAAGAGAASSSAAATAASDASGASGGSSSSDALEGFLLLAKTSSGAQCVMVIQLVLKHPSIFVFGELLDVPSVKQLEHSEHKKWYELLKLFAYGTYAEYKSTPGLPDVGEVELTKLKQLTLVNMAAKQRILPYSTLQSSLHVPDLRSLEDLIISCMYAGVLEGHLNQKDSTLEVTSAMGRDIGPEDVQEMIAQLGAWLSSTDVVLGTLRSQVQRVQCEESRARAEECELDAQKSKLMEELKTNKIASPSGGAVAVAGDDGRKAKKAQPGGKTGVLGMFGRR